MNRPKFDASKDNYAILGVPPNSTPEKIKQRFRELALKHHPDRNKDATAAKEFNEMREAYDILIDGETRAAYDRARTELIRQANEREQLGRNLSERWSMMARSQTMNGLPAFGPTALESVQETWHAPPSDELLIDERQYRMEVLRAGIREYWEKALCFCMAAMIAIGIRAVLGWSEAIFSVPGVPLVRKCGDFALTGVFNAFGLDVGSNVALFWGLVIGNLAAISDRGFKARRDALKAGLKAWEKFQTGHAAADAA